MKFDRWLGLIAFVIALIILWQMQQVLLLTFTAVLVATVLNRVVKFLQSKGIKRQFALILTGLSLLLISVIVSLAIIPPFIDQFQELIQKIPLGVEQLSNWINNLSGRIPDPVINAIQDSLSRLVDIAQLFVSRVLSNFFVIFSNTLNAALTSLFVLVLSIMLLASPSDYRNVFILLFPKSFREKLDEILTGCEEAISGWSIGILCNMSIIGTLSWIGLLIIGVPLALANALLAGLLTFIPNVGPTLSVIPPAAIALVESPWKALGVVILYIVIQQVESNILTPLIMQKQVSLLPALALLSQLTFAIFFGFLGLLLALPLALILQVVLREFIVKDIMEKL